MTISEVKLTEKMKKEILSQTMSRWLLLASSTGELFLFLQRLGRLHVFFLPLSAIAVPQLVFFSLLSRKWKVYTALEKMEWKLVLCTLH